MHMVDSADEMKLHEQGNQLTCSAAYLIEVIAKRRFIRTRFNFDG
jgi:hypothetical protein